MVAALGLIVLAPLIAVLAGTVRIVLGSPVIFRQPRPGIEGRLFALLKFRTMSAPLNSRGEPLCEAERVTRFGVFLRSTSLDELPELWNVLRGDMSLVGPRPLLVEYLPIYSREQARRHEVRPGITGWAQVNGRNRLSWEERFMHDVWYVDHVSLGTDLKILFRTLAMVLRREGISADSHVTMHRFTGNKT